MHLYLFPLANVVFFPTGTLPLNVFEPRYVQMISDALDANVPVALSYLDPTDSDDQKAISSMPSGRLVVGAGQAVLFEKREDGTMVIFVKGSYRYRVEKVLSTDPYIICEASLLEDQAKVHEENRFFLKRLHHTMGEWIEKNIADAEQKRVITAQTEAPWRLIEIFASSKMEDPDSRQALLECSDINDRIDLLKKLI